MEAIIMPGKKKSTASAAHIVELKVPSNQPKKNKNKKSKNKKNKKGSIPIVRSTGSNVSNGTILTRNSGNRLFDRQRLANGRNGERIRGHEYLSPISSGAKTTGQNILNLQLNPINLDNSRLQKFANLYEKYVFRKFTLHYITAQATSTTGQYIMSYDKDTADNTPPASAAGVTQYFAMQDAVISSAWQNSSLPCSLTDPQDFYYTNYSGYEGRIVFQGQVYMACASDGTFVGSIWIEYDIELWDPMVDSLTERSALITGNNNATHVSSTSGTGYNLLNDVNDGVVFDHGGNRYLGNLKTTSDTSIRGVILNGGEYQVLIKFDAYYLSGPNSSTLINPKVKALEFTYEVSQTLAETGANDLSSTTSWVPPISGQWPLLNTAPALVYTVGVLKLPIGKTYWVFFSVPVLSGSPVSWHIATGDLDFQVSYNYGSFGLYDLYLKLRQKRDLYLKSKEFRLKEENARQVLEDVKGIGEEMPEDFEPINRTPLLRTNSTVDLRKASESLPRKFPTR